MRFFNHGSEMSVVVVVFVAIGVVFSCQNKRGDSKLSNEVRAPFPGYELDYVNRVEILGDTPRIVVKDIDRNWYYAGMEMIDSVKFYDALYAIQAFRCTELSRVRGVKERSQALKIVLSGPMANLPDTLSFMSSGIDSTRVVCATNFERIRCVACDELYEAIFYKLVDVINNR